MPTRIEFHVLQSFAPSNLNRDDTGSPKDALFGGARRGRISSQALKRASRRHMRDNGLVPEAAASHRTARLADLVAQGLVAGGVAPDVAQAAAIAVVGGIGKGKNRVKVKDGKTDVLLFVGQAEVEAIIATVLPEAQTAATGKGKAFDALAEAVVGILEAGPKRARDIALFGRMLAVLPSANVDAACQVAHAISTHRVDREFDYYTAVDDLNPADRIAADMVGTVEFGSACYYRYSVIDLDHLRHNLGGDVPAAADTVTAYARAVVESAPTGKQNTFAAHNPPSMVLVAWRSNGAPRSLANAFERPVPADREGFVDASVARLREAWLRTETAYGAADRGWLLDLTDAFGTADGVERVERLADLITVLDRHARS
jgi:CRISPR system Cascade subunit CasC